MEFTSSKNFDMISTNNLKYVGYVSAITVNIVPVSSEYSLVYLFWLFLP